MKCETTPGGIVVPVAEEPEPTTPPPARAFGPLELRDPAKRMRAIVAMELLWDAMVLEGHGILADEHDRRQAEPHWKLWSEMADAILGEDAPYKEVLT